MFLIIFEYQTPTTTHGNTHIAFGVAVFLWADHRLWIGSARQMYPKWQRFDFERIGAGLGFLYFQRNFYQVLECLLYELVKKILFCCFFKL